MRRRKNIAGLSLVELVVAFTILLLLTSMAVPLARTRVRRDKERELRFALREMRMAIDKYKDACDQGTFGPAKMDTECFPETLEQLVEGATVANDANGKKIKFLRRIPKDPMTGMTDWGFRNMKDDPKSLSWGGQHVFDVYTKSYEKARDGTSYSDW